MSDRNKLQDHLPADLDELIEHALRSEPMLSAPINFHRKVEERVRIAALKEREHTRFRFWMLSLAASACGALFVAATLVAVTNFNVIVTNGVSGGKGTFDYYLTTLLGGGVETYSGSYTFMTSVLLAGVALAAGWMPLRRLMDGSYKLGRSSAAR